MSFKNRVQKANQTKPQVISTTVHNKARIVSMKSLSDPAISYQISLDWTIKGEINGHKYLELYTDCKQIAIDKGTGYAFCTCEGSKHTHTCCYHVISAVKAAAKFNGKVMSVCDSLDKAIKLLNFGGTLVKVLSGSGIMWSVVR